MDRKEATERAIHGVRTSILNNATAYGFSVMITLVLLATQEGTRSVSTGRLFLFAVGATTAFAIVEGVATSGFRVRVKPDPSEAVALGSAFAMGSVVLSLGTAVLLLRGVGGAPAWFLAPFAATTVFVSASGIELALARWQEERMETKDEEEEPADD